MCLCRGYCVCLLRSKNSAVLFLLLTCATNSSLMCHCSYSFMPPLCACMPFFWCIAL